MQKKQRIDYFTTSGVVSRVRLACGNTSFSTSSVTSSSLSLSMIGRRALVVFRLREIRAVFAVK